MKKNFPLLLLAVFSFAFPQLLLSQDNVGIGTTTPRASAVVDIESNNKGLLIPRMSTAQRTGILQPLLGPGDRALLVYDTNDDLFYFWDGTQWIPFPLDNDATNELQSLSLSNDTLYLQNGGFVVLPTSVVDADADSTNELQNLTISNDTVFLSNGGFVVLPPGAVDTDDQQLSLSNDTLFLQDGGFVILTDQVNDADADSTNEIQFLSQNGDTIFLSDGGFVLLSDQVNDADADSTNELQVLSQNGDTIFLSDGGFVVIQDSVGFDTDDQQLSLSNDTLFLQDGGFVILTDNVNDADSDSTNEIQFLSQNGDTIFLSDGGFVLLSDQVNDADADSTNEIQFLSQNGDTIFLSDGGFVVIQDSVGIDTDDQQLSLSNDTLFLQDGGFVILTDNVNDADSDSTNEIQFLSQNGDTIFLSDGGFVLLSDQVNDADADSTNEIQFLSQNGDTIFLSDGGFVVIQDSVGIDTDDQQLSLSNDTLFLQDGGFVILTDNVNDADADSTNEIQFLSQNGDTIFLSDGGQVIIPSYSDPDADSTNELQNLTISNDTVFLSNGGFVVLPPGAVDTDDQQLSLSNDTLFLQDGGFVVLPSGSVDTDDQTLLLSNDTLFIADGNFVILPDNVVDADADSTNELQDLNLIGSSLGLTNSLVTVDLSPFLDNTDTQQLSISNDTIYLTSGGFVVLPGSAAFSLDTIWLSGPGLITGSGTSMQLQVNANNGLNIDPVQDAVQLGGGLIENTQIDQGNFAMTWNLSGTGDFDIQDNSNSVFLVQDDGNIGIGVTNPIHYIHFEKNGVGAGIWQTAWDNTGPTDAVMRAQNTNAANGSRVMMGTTNYPGVALEAVGVIGISLPNIGDNKGVIGVSNSADGVGVEGRLAGASNNGWGGVFYNGLGYTGFFGVASDQRVKKEVKQINDALELVKSLRGVTYYHDFDKYPYLGLDAGMQYGFIAQELEQVLPELVREKKLNAMATAPATAESAIESKTEILKTVNYTSLVPILVEAIKQQQQIIESQEIENEEQQKSIEELSKRLEDLERLLDSEN